MIPPLLIRIKVKGNKWRRRGRGLWLPIFVLWPFFAVLVLVGLVISLILDVAAWLGGAEYHRYTLLLLKCLGTVSALRGLKVLVDSREQHVEIRLI